MTMLPDGVTPDALSEINIYDLARTDPERAMIYVDLQIKSFVSSSRDHFIEQAKRIYFVEMSELWRYHPEGFASLAEWCQQPEIDIPPSVLSDMKAIMKLAPHVMEQTDPPIDLLELIREVGHSKVRTIVPALKKSYRDGTLSEQAPHLVDIARSTSCKQIYELLNPGGQRLHFDFEAVYIENKNGTYSVALRDLDYDDLESVAAKLNIRRWFDVNGRRIDPPILGPDEELLALES